MKMGTRSVLFGVHQFIWHPLTVFLAWKDLFGWPSWWEVVCIVVHDVGYIGKADMDGAGGKDHPVLGAKIAGLICGERGRLMCLGHSRSFATAHGLETSMLCWADKWSPMFDPTHFYWLRGELSGEIAEYRRSFPRAGGQSSLMWAVAFKDFVKEHASAIWQGAQGVKDHGYAHVFIPDGADERTV